MTKEYWDTKTETINLSELKNLQFKRLKNMIKYIYDNNEVYHN